MSEKNLTDLTREAAQIMREYSINELETSGQGVTIKLKRDSLAMLEADETIRLKKDPFNQKVHKITSAGG